MALVSSSILFFIALGSVALVAGIGITTVGPGGVFVTAALHGLTDLSSASVAGTASATFVATGLVGSSAYARSGELSAGPAWEAAVVLSVTGTVGALLGTRLNVLTGDELFGTLLSAFLIGTAGLIAYREWVGIEPGGLLGGSAFSRRVLLGGTGGAVGVMGGLLGVGGPVVAVPALVGLGMPMLRAIAVAQVQSIFLSLFAAIGYGIVGAVDPALALLVGLPQLAGVLLGWRLAHRVPAQQLRIVLAGTLVVVGGITAF
ncbi:sulfite exporter TauE/SafE family protein [Salinibacter altiplanensis]|uniref:sulfite exporter TauE/SafE family protein n=1 Tax=Salinibacter altiplanensis TaxID=1803181 RepID=UPI000C9F48C5|nr:sulfite exporter TauE/SafE family protein [Salinibacter altiplanensis]